MPILILLFFLSLSFAEFRLLSSVFQAIAKRYDGMSAIFLILVSFAVMASVGARLMRFQGRALRLRLQSGELLSRDASRNFLWFLAGILLIIPGYVSDLFALLLLFPPTAWVMYKLIGKLLQKLSKRASFTFATQFGMGGRDPFRDAQKTRGNDSIDPTVIDVEAYDASKKLL